MKHTMTLVALLVVLTSSCAIMGEKPPCVYEAWSNEEIAEKAKQAIINKGYPEPKWDMLKESYTHEKKNKYKAYLAFFSLPPVSHVVVRFDCKAEPIYIKSNQWGEL